MKALIQRVSQAKVEIDSEVVGQIRAGLLVLLGVDKHDDADSARRLAEKVINYRIFSDDSGRMNLSLSGANAQLLVVSQFTLSANTQKGLRPSFASAAAPEEAEKLYECFLSCCRENVDIVETGRFGGNMQVSLTNDGPVTFLLEN